MHTLKTFTLVLLVVLLFGAGTARAQSVTISPPSASVPVANSFQFSATTSGLPNVTCITFPCYQVRWSVNGVAGGNSTVGTVGGDGLYTAPSAIPNPATVTVTATSLSTPTKSASAAVTITASLVQVSISPATLSADLGGIYGFSATVTGAANTGVTWSVNGIVGGNSTVGTITLIGTYFAPSIRPAGGTVTITAKSVADPTKSATATVTFATLQVFISPETVSVQLGLRQQFTATVSAFVDPTMRWTVNGIPGGNATVGTITSSGLYTAPLAVPSPKVVNVTATSVADPTKYATAAVTIIPIPVRVSIAPTAVALDTGKQQQFTAAVSGSDNTGVIWSVNGIRGGTLTAGTITQTGLYTAPPTRPNPGDVPVTATSVADPTASATAIVTINLVVIDPRPGPAVSVAISPTDVFVSTGTTEQFTATASGVTGASFRWFVNNSLGGYAAIGTITQTGLYTAPATALNFPISITATLISDPTKSATAQVTVIPATVLISVSPRFITLDTAATQRFTTTITGTTSPFVKWAVNGFDGGSAAVGTITSDGIYTAPQRTPSPALVRITATSLDNPKASGTALVTISPVTLSISPSSIILNTGAGASQRFFATVSGTANKAVRWTVNGVLGAVTEYGQITQEGYYIAPPTLPTPSTVNVTVTSLADPSISATAKVFLKDTLGTQTPPSGSSGSLNWRNADIIFYPGTRSVKFHLDDLYGFSDRKIFVSMAVIGNFLGWGTRVYPDSERPNGTFYFGDHPIDAVGAQGPPMIDGRTWQLKITLNQMLPDVPAKKKTWNGILRIDSPRTLKKGILGYPISIPLNQSIILNFAVADGTMGLPGLVSEAPSLSPRDVVRPGPGIIQTIAGTDDPTGYIESGIATQINVFPQGNGVADAQGNFYFSDRANGAEVIRKLSPSGNLSVYAGGLGSGYSGDGGPAPAARLFAPAGLAMDSAGNLYVADSLNHRVRKIDRNGTITTVAGNGIPASSGDNGPALKAGIPAPQSLAIDSIGNLYIAEAQRVRVVAGDGTIVTVAGIGQPGVDTDNVPATTTSLNVASIALDPAGDLYIADASGTTDRIRKVDIASGMLTTIAGTGECCASAGDGGPATLAVFGERIRALAFDNPGNLYVADGLSIRKIGTDGIVHRFAGDGTDGSDGDGGPATAARLQNVGGLAADAAGNVFIADFNRVREVGGGGGTTPIKDLFSDTGISIGNQRTTTMAPPATGCTLPDSVTAFLKSDKTVYLYLDGVATRNLTLSSDWRAPDGAVIPGVTWEVTAGSHCFTGSSLPIGSLPQSRLGSWTARFYADGVLVFSLPFTVNAPPGAPSDPPPATRTFVLSTSSGISLLTDSDQGALETGYGKVQPDPGSATPNGVAIYNYRQNGVLVSEAAVPANPTLIGGRIYASVNASVNTGLAIVNPNDDDVTVDFYFTDLNGNNFGGASTVIPANGKIARFLSEAPFNLNQNFEGTFTFIASGPIAAIALRVRTNERSEVLFTTLPVANLNDADRVDDLFFPQFAEGNGWFTQIVLVNPGNTALTGTVRFTNPAGAPQPVNVDGTSSSSFGYTLPPRAVVRLQTSGTAAAAVSGSVRVVPDAGMTAPSGLVIFAFRNGGVVVSEAGVPAERTGTAFRLFAETSGSFPKSGSLQTGVAITNPSPGTAQVSLQFIPANGGAIVQGSLSIPPNGQVAKFVSEIPGLESLPSEFQGVLRVSSASPISVVSLRGRYNERTDFLMSTAAAVDDSAFPGSQPLFFPHFVFGSGYTTQFILLGPQTGSSSSGILEFFSDSGIPLDLPVR